MPSFFEDLARAAVHYRMHSPLQQILSLAGSVCPRNDGSADRSGLGHSHRRSVPLVVCSRVH